MKSILLALLLSVTAAQSQVISNLVYSAPGVRIYAVIIFTDTNFTYQPIALPPPTNPPPVVKPKPVETPITILEKKIRDEEARIQKFWGDLPAYYAENNSGQSEYNLNKILELWTQKNTAVSNLNVMKAELELLRKSK